MGVFFVAFGIFVAVVFCTVAVIIGMTIYKANQKDKKNKGDYLSPKPVEYKYGDPFSERKSGAEKSAEKTVEKPSAVHANCDHAKKPSPYIDINDTYSMVWDEFKSFSLKLLAAEYPSAKISPYKYRGSPDIQLKTGGKDVDVRLIFVREDVVVDKSDFAAALKDIDVEDEVADWIITNGRFSVMQRSSANAKRVTLYDRADMFAMMRRCNISAKEK